MAVLKAKIGGVWTEIGGVGTPGAPGPDEVVAGTVAPTDPAADLWVDTTDPAAPVLKMKDGTGVWIAPPSGGGEEVFVGSDDPYLTDPAGTWDIWLRPPGIGFTGVCPQTGDGLTAYASGGSESRQFKMNGLKPSQAYYFDSVSYSSSRTRTADGNGEASWGWYTSTPGPDVINIRETDVNGPIVFTTTVTWLPKPIITSPTTATVGVPYTVSIAGFQPGSHAYLEITSNVNEVTIPSPDATTDASGVASWTVTPILAGSVGMYAWELNPPGSPCGTGTPPFTGSGYRLQLPSVTIT